MTTPRELINKASTLSTLYALSNRLGSSPRLSPEGIELVNQQGEARVIGSDISEAVDTLRAEARERASA